MWIFARTDLLKYYLRNLPWVEDCWDGGAISDFYAENPIEGEGSKEDFPNKNILNIEQGAWKTYFDNVVNHYGNRIGVFLITPYGSHIPMAVKLIFEATNNMVEYEACIARTGSSMRTKGKGGRGLWRFNISHSLSSKVMENEAGTSKAIPTIFRVDGNLW